MRIQFEISLNSDNEDYSDFCFIHWMVKSQNGAILISDRGHLRMTRIILMPSGVKQELLLWEAEVINLIR